MHSTTTAQSIRKRFLEEQLDVRNYTEFVLKHLQVDYAHASEMVVKLRELDSTWQKGSSAFASSGETLTKQAFDMEYAIQLTGRIMASLRQKITFLCPGINEVDLLGSKVKHQQYVMKKYGRRLLTLDYDLVKEECTKQWKKKNDIVDDHADVSVMANAVRHAFASRYAEELRSIERLKRECEDMQLVVKSSKPESGINVRRQGFISLMTAFDAAMFDLVRVALRNRFFTLAVALGKLTVEDVSKYANFDELRDDFIEAELKKRYLKDLLHLLKKSWHVECIPASTGKRIERLNEMVMRRNIHVHNRGIVDERYVNGVNLDSLALGAIAVIDSAYWDRANTLCISCIEQVANWAERPA